MKKGDRVKLSSSGLEYLSHPIVKIVAMKVRGTVVSVRKSGVTVKWDDHIGKWIYPMESLEIAND